MFPLVDRDGVSKPVIQIIGEEAIDSGIEQICIVTQPGEEQQYRDYFRRMTDLEVRQFRGKDWAILESEKLGAFGERTSFVEQHTPEGFGHAVYQAREWVGDEPFLLLLGDHIYVSDEGVMYENRVLSLFGRRGRWMRWEDIIEVREIREKSKEAFAHIETWEIDVPIATANPESHKTVTQNFVNAIRKNEPLIAPGEEGVRGLEIGNAMLMAGVTRQGLYRLLHRNGLWPPQKGAAATEDGDET